MDAATCLADDIVDQLALRDAAIDRTRLAQVGDADVLHELAARSLDLLAVPAALATNIRLLEGEAEVPKQRWSSSRIGDGQVVHSELRNPYIDRSVAQGGMVVVDSIDELDVTLMRLREALEYRLSARAWINLYLTAGTSSNFGLHYDTCDTLIIQLLGSKRWQVGNTGQPEGAVVDPSTVEQLRTIELRPGSVLALPARALHNATGVGVFTMHLTIGFDRSAAVPYLAGEVDTLLGHRRQIAPAELEIAKARVAERRRGTSLPYIHSNELTERTNVRWAMRLRPIVEQAPDGSLRIVSGSCDFVCSGRLAAVVRVLAAGDEHTVDQLVRATGLDARQVVEAVREIAAQDLVICRFGR